MMISSTILFHIFAIGLIVSSFLQSIVFSWRFKSSLKRDPLSFLSSRVNLLLEGPYKWEEEFYEQMPIDHFSYVDSRTFRLRYLLNTENFNQKNGPIFFYTGNEGSIEGFAYNTGFMWDLAPKFGAAVIFAEHRYYGKSQPFGNSTYEKIQNLGYLSSEQALADYAQLIDFLKNQRLTHAKNSPVIAFGGSYGGMLSAWMRIKYPHHIVGAIASSAPVFWFGNAKIDPQNSFDIIVTRTFRLSGCNSKAVMLTFSALQAFAQTEKGRDFLNKEFHLSDESKILVPSDGDKLVSAIQEVMETLAMVDYPYESNFLAPLPAWPVKVACKSFGSKPKKSLEEYATAAYDVANLFYNYTGQLKTFCLIGANCPDTFAQLGGDVWSWQACTEMIMPQCSSGPPGSFFKRTCPFSDAQDLEMCQNMYGKIGFKPEMFRPNWALINYGTEFPGASNIIFSNGYLDPWSGGGWSQKPQTKNTLVGLIVEDGAHHYDLRGENPNDTKSVKEIRRIEEAYITNWIAEANQNMRKEHLKPHYHHYLQRKKNHNHHHSVFI